MLARVAGCCNTQSARSARPKQTSHDEVEVTVSRLLARLSSRVCVRRCCGLLLTCWLLSLVAGCGADTYERRLQETRKYFEYLDTMNQLLSPTPWSEMGVSLRVPKQFQLIPAPASRTPDGKPRPVRPQADPRQPRFLKLTLPGLLGAWKATVPVDTEKGTVQAPAYLYVCGNHYLWLEKETKPDVDPLSFDLELARRLAPVVHAPPPTPDDDWPWTHERIPPPGSYVASRPFDTIRFEVRVQGRPYDLQLYRYHTGNIQVMILYLIPQDVPRRTGLHRAMELSLHTLEVSPELPSQQPAASPVVPGF